MRPAILIPAFAALLLIWSGVAIVMHVTDPYIITPEKVTELVKQAPWKGGKKPGPAERKAFLQQVADDVNKLDFEGQRRLREDGRDATEDFFLDLTEDERRWFVAQTVERQFQQVMKTFKAMSVEERKKMLNTSRAEMRKNGRDVDSLDGLVNENEKAFEIMTQDGIGDYYAKGDDKRKLRLAPLLGELQSRMLGGRRK
ncbi:MAG: hypothetical protein JWO94_1007 [Verrucomicrobiaceae bacterium]|nr:hypothetical protein [Verrucomicrobiaceae bacterium]